MSRDFPPRWRVAATRGSAVPLSWLPGGFSLLRTRSIVGTQPVGTSTSDDHGRCGDVDVCRWRCGVLDQTERSWNIFDSRRFSPLFHPLFTIKAARPHSTQRSKACRLRAAGWVDRLLPRWSTTHDPRPTPVANEESKSSESSSFKYPPWQESHSSRSQFGGTTQKGLPVVILDG